MARARLRAANRVRIGGIRASLKAGGFKGYNPPARPLLSPFNRGLGVAFLGVMVAYLLTLSNVPGVALVAMLGAFVGLIAAAVARR